MGEEKISSITLSQGNILNNNNKMIIQKRDNKKNFKLYKVYSNDNKNNNNNINLFNDLEKLKQRTKNILGAYLSYINNEN